MKPLNQTAVAVAMATIASVAGAHESHAVISYLNLLDQNAAVREAHENNPVASMVLHGLNGTEQQTLLSGDVKAIANMVGVEVARDDPPQCTSKL
jgi:hypothetical protein